MCFSCLPDDLRDSTKRGVQIIDYTVTRRYSAVRALCMHITYSNVRNYYTKISLKKKKFRRLYIYIYTVLWAECKLINHCNISFLFIFKIIHLHRQA